MLIGILVQQIGIERCNVQVKFPQNSVQNMQFKINKIFNNQVETQITDSITLITQQYYNLTNYLYSLTEVVLSELNVDICKQYILDIEQTINCIDYNKILEFEITLIEGTRYNQQQFKELIEQNALNQWRSLDEIPQQVLQTGLCIYDLQYQFTQQSNENDIYIQVLQIPGLNSYRLQKFINMSSQMNMHNWREIYNKSGKQDLPLFKKINTYISNLDNYSLTAQHSEGQDGLTAITLLDKQLAYVDQSGIEQRYSQDIPSDSNKQEPLVYDINDYFQNYILWLQNFQAIVDLYFQQLDLTTVTNLKQHVGWFKFIQHPNIWVLHQQTGNYMCQVVQCILQKSVEELLSYLINIQEISDQQVAVMLQQFKPEQINKFVGVMMYSEYQTLMNSTSISQIVQCMFEYVSLSSNQETA